MNYTKFNASFRQSVLAVAQELGLEFISTKRQVENGTLLFADPQCTNRGIRYALHESGYVRRYVQGGFYYSPNYWNHYPLNRRTSWTKQSAHGWKYRQMSSYQKAHGDEQLGILVRAVLNYRNK